MAPLRDTPFFFLINQSDLFFGSQVQGIFKVQSAPYLPDFFTSSLAMAFSTALPHMTAGRPSRRRLEVARMTDVVLVERGEGGHVNDNLTCAGRGVQRGVAPMAVSRDGALA